MRNHCLIFAAIAFTTNCTLAADFYHVLSVRYEGGLVKNFLGGPYNGKAGCEKNAQAVWDNVITTCGSCTKEVIGCMESSAFPDLYKKTFRNEIIPNPYVAATQKGRIVYSGVGHATAFRECQHTATQFRTSGFPQAVCISP